MEVYIYCPECGHHGMDVEIEEAAHDTNLDIVAECKGCKARFNAFVPVAEMTRLES